jgi:FlaA1/EpsC-like NDP-sugar epimerase
MKDLFRVLSAILSLLALVIAFIPEEWTSLQTDGFLATGIILGFVTIVFGLLAEIVPYDDTKTPFIRVSSATAFIAGLVFICLSKANNDLTNMSYTLASFFTLLVLAGGTRVIAEIMSLWKEKYSF